MSSTQSKPNGETVPPPPIFSYAQAAKGRAAATTASAIQSHQTATSGMSTPPKDVTSTTNTPSGGSERGDRSVNGNEATSKVETPEVVRNQDRVETTATKPVSSPASPSLGTASTATLPREDKDDSFTLVGSSTDSNRDRGSHGGSIATEKPAEGGEGRKGKKGKKQKNAEKEAEKEKEKAEVVPEVFVPAPLPTVNFWQQRKEEAAKTKPSSLQSQPSLDASSLGVSASGQTTKSSESKKRGKPSGPDEADRSSSTAQNGTTKDAQATTRGQKKGVDTTSKKEDQSGKRAGARGSRTGEKDEKAVTSQLPPPVEDAMSWPTPETALEEEKRKSQDKMEKDEKDDNAPNKPRPKEKWVQVPYIPSVTFNTPLPTRGGRGRGGARGGRVDGSGRASHATNGAGEKPQNGSATTNLVVDGDGKSSSDTPTAKGRTSTEQTSARKASVVQSGEKAKSGSSKTELNGHDGPVHASSSSHLNQAFEAHQDQSFPRGENMKGLKAEQMQANFYDNQSYQRQTADRKNDLRGPADQSREGPAANKDSLQRERNDGRSDRGRGNPRGRAGHAFPNGQPHPQNAFTNGHPSTTMNGYPIRQASGPYSPPLQPPPFSNQYPQPPARGGRGGSRSQSIPNNAMYGRFAQNGGPQHMPSLQTSNAMYDYQHAQGPMSAAPYQPFMDQASVLAMVTMQLEYYFSIDNLCKDVFLRKHMDSQGFVFLAFIAGFKRIQALTQEFELLRFACQESEIIELVRGDDNADRLRRKDGWEKWVLPMEERDESTRNPGPSYFMHRQQQPQKSTHGGSMNPNQYPMTPGAFSPNGVDSGFRQYLNGATSIPLQNGNGGGYHPEIPLSATVPNFTPGLLPKVADPLDTETTFNDDEVTNLTLVFKAPKGGDSTKSKPTFPSTPSRTFSNGSIDGRSIAEELFDDQRQGRTLTNGSHVPETSPSNIRRSRSPFAPLSPTQANFNDGPPVMWVKGQRQQALVSPGNSEELYSSFRARALKIREVSAPGETHPDMKLLYEFWSHFLCRNFNATMYSEFRKYAIEDAESNASSGMENLINYYAEILNSKKKVIPDVLAMHYVDLVKKELMSGPRPGLEKLRSSWRDGALDMKSRKRIDNLVDSQLREELERAPHQKAELS